MKAAREAVDGNPGKVIDEAGLLETDMTLLEDLRGRGSVRDVKEDYGKYGGNPLSEYQVKLKLKD